MKLIETRYNPRHPMYQEEHFNKNINISQPNKGKQRLEYHRPSPLYFPEASAPPIGNNTPFVHH